MTTRQTLASLSKERSPGERAFDRALMSLFFFLLAWSFIDSSMEQSAVSTAPDWLAFCMRVAVFCLWIWLVRGVVVAWSDPFARVLRISSVLLLLFYAVIVFSLLRAPFR